MWTRRIAAALALLAAPAAAESFRQVTDRAAFLALVEGRDLTRLGIRLSVSPDGAIGGRAFGRAVDGAWSWRDGYFCRRIDAGGFNLPMNCQLVLRAGDTLRFVADRGRGDAADLTLD